MLNLITDVPGLLVGHATDLVAGTGTTVVLFEAPATCAVDVRGGAPGTRETDLLGPEKTVSAVDAVVLSGGSAFGLDAAGAVAEKLAAQGRGFAVGPVRVPIVPSAILFDLLNGGAKWFGTADPVPPYRRLGAEALAAARVGPFALGTVGAGTGATTADLAGGLGSASMVTAAGHVVGALVAVNALGSVTIGDGPHFRAALHEVGAEFGGLGLPPRPDDRVKLKGITAENTTIAIVATDAALTKAECRHMAVMAQDGLAQAIFPVHTPLDGDTVFAAATGRRPLEEPLRDLTLIGAAAASTLARAIARAVYAAEGLPFEGAKPAWKARFS